MKLLIGSKAIGLLLLATSYSPAVNGKRTSVGGGSSSSSSSGGSTSSGSSFGSSSNSFSSGGPRPSSSVNDGSFGGPSGNFGSSSPSGTTPLAYTGGNSAFFYGGPHRRYARYRNNRLNCNFRCDTGSGSASNDGVNVCRTLYSPISGDPQEHVVCIEDRNNDRAWVSDDCGCCGDLCPDGPPMLSFQELDCPEVVNNVNISVAAERSARNFDAGSDEESDLVVTICRDLYNPFTGEPVPDVTLQVPPSKGLQGDVCGCCNGECPEPGEQLQGFLRPAPVDTNCPAEETVECELPANDQNQQQNETKGIVICRSYVNPFTGEAGKATVCIPPTQGWESDQCGCCDAVDDEQQECPPDDTPLSPSPICDSTDNDSGEDNDFSCELRRGESGVFVCRSLFHPLDGLIRFRPLCVKDTWVSDTCGCCFGECPETPEDGFEDESVQLLMLALEHPDLEIVNYGSDDSSAPASMMHSWAVLTFLASIGSFLYWM